MQEVTLWASKRGLGGRAAQRERGSERVRGRGAQRERSSEPQREKGTEGEGLRERRSSEEESLNLVGEGSSEGEDRLRGKKMLNVQTTAARNKNILNQSKLHRPL